MSNIWVVDASPIILLAKIGQQNLFTQLANQFIIPIAVKQEIEAGSISDPAYKWLQQETLSFVSVNPHPAIIAWDLGLGETAVLSYALANPTYRVVIDDGMARRCAHTLRIPIIGTLGIILKAKQNGLIPSAKSLLHELLAHNFRIQDAILAQVLRKTVNEEWP